MHPTHTTTGTDPTPADILRYAALYLVRHGWHQGDMYANPDQLTPAACLQGAIKMAVCGGPTVDYTAATVDQVDTAIAVLADHLTLYGYIDMDDHDEDSVQFVADWNDTTGRTITQVLAVLLAAANDWDWLHPAGGAA